MLAYPALNGLIGSDQMTGGCNCYRIGVKTTADGARYKLATVKGKPAVSTKNATYLCRTQKLFSQTDEYKARVAAGEKDPKPKLPWLNVPSTSDNQALVSIVNEYPYRAKILVSWTTNTLQATSGALRDSVIEKLKDPVRRAAPHCLRRIHRRACAIGRLYRARHHAVRELRRSHARGLLARPGQHGAVASETAKHRRACRRPLRKLRGLLRRRCTCLQPSRLRRERYRERRRHLLSIERCSRLLLEGRGQPGLRHRAGGRCERRGRAVAGAR
ncbi:MAG: hypothetical protein V8S24_12945 [Gordonibacter pamelaeae]